METVCLTTRRPRCRYISSASSPPAAAILSRAASTTPDVARTPSAGDPAQVSATDAARPSGKNRDSSFSVAIIVLCSVLGGPFAGRRIETVRDFISVRVGRTYPPSTQSATSIHGRNFDQSERADHSARWFCVRSNDVTTVMCGCARAHSVGWSDAIVCARRLLITVAVSSELVQ